MIFKKFMKLTARNFTKKRHENLSKEILLCMSMPHSQSTGQCHKTPHNKLTNFLTSDWQLAHHNSIYYDTFSDEIFPFIATWREIDLLCWFYVGEEEMFVPINATNGFLTKIGFHDILENFFIKCIERKIWMENF